MGGSSISQIKTHQDILFRCQSAKAAQWPVGRERKQGILFEKGSVLRNRRVMQFREIARPYVCDNYTFQYHKAGQQIAVKYIVKSEDGSQYRAWWDEANNKLASKKCKKQYKF